MFSKQQQQPAAASKPVETKPAETRTEAKKGPVTNTPSIISADMNIAGDLRTAGDVQVDGNVEGDIYAKNLSVGKTAVINGEVFSDIVKIWGCVNGRVRGRDITVLETAKVRGDILHESLEVARGAYVEGMIKQEDYKEAPSSKTGESDSRQGAKMNVVVGNLDKDKEKDKPAGGTSAGTAATSAGS